VAGITLIFAGSLLIYFETYKNNQLIDAAGYLLGFFGWMVLFIRITKGTSIDADKIMFKDDKAGWFVQRISNLFYYLVLIAIIFANGYFIIKMSHARKREILADQPTKTAIAIIDHIEVRKGRSSTSYYAVFQYAINGEILSHPGYEENEADFLVGDKYMIKYSVEYPEMFKIIAKVQ
jgi:hypothetical protein